MKKRNNIRSGVIAIAIAVDLDFSTLAFAGDPARLVGKELDQNRELVVSVMQGRNYVVEVDQKGLIKQVVDTGANGDGTEMQQTANLTTKKDAPSTASSIELPENYQGQYAIDHIGANLPKIAAIYGLTPDKLKDILLTDDTVRIDSNNRIFYVDNDVEQQTGVESNVVGATVNGASSKDPALPMASPVMLAKAFNLHSKAGANITLYLDFVGYTAENTTWSKTTVVAPPYDLGGNPAVFDNNERTNIISIWNRVSEDFIPFDIDVTTEPPSTDALLRTSTADNTYGTRVVITKSGIINRAGGGVAYVGVGNMINNTAFQPAWVFQQALANNEKYIAEAVSHEAGHTFGLLHDGQKTATRVKPYYLGHGSDVTGWAPIMGIGYNKNLTQWSSGAYPGATNHQDDILVLEANGIPKRTDEIGDTFATATALTNINTGGTVIIQKFGIIETANDVDMYKMNTVGGVVNITVSPAATGSNLDAQLILYRPNGTVLTTSAPAAKLAANINKAVPAGTYYLAVRGSRHSMVGSDYGYPKYGSLGQYQVTGSYVKPSSAGLPKPVLGVSSATSLTIKPPTQKILQAASVTMVANKTNLAANARALLKQVKKRQKAA